MNRRTFGKLLCICTSVIAGCAEYEEGPGDKETKAKIVGYWYWSWDSRKYGTFHILTNRRSDGTYIRNTVVIPVEQGEVETSEESGKWGINLGRYVEKPLISDGESSGTGQRDQRYIIKTLSEQAVELQGERVRGPEQIERRVDATFKLPRSRGDTPKP
jgi:hypothetical protein